MNRELLHQAGPLLVKAATTLAGVLLVKYKKQIEGFLLRFLGRFNSIDKELQELRDAGAERIDSLLYLLLRDPNYLGDRVTITLYELQDDGGAFVTCEAEVRASEMSSMRRLQRTPIPAELASEIWAITHLPGQALYVPDARASLSAALRTTLPAAGVWSAYYQLMPAGKPTERRLLAMSWHTEHLLNTESLNSLHLSGIACAAVLELTSRAKRMQEK